MRNKDVPVMKDSPEPIVIWVNKYLITEKIENVNGTNPSAESDHAVGNGETRGGIY